jgi:hypothetical protein
MFRGKVTVSCARGKARAFLKNQRGINQMKRFAVAISVLALLLGSAPAFGQSATATGTGVGVANSKSKSTAVAISGQGGQGGGGGNSSLVVNNPANTTAATSSTSTIKQEVTGTSTIRNVPTAIAPSLAAAGLETCLGSISGGGSFVGTGFSFGSTIPDAGCAARLDARTLWAFGLKKAAIVRLCLQPEIYRSMVEVCDQYNPHSQPAWVPIAVAVAAPEYTGGAVEVVLRSGEHRMCGDYDVSRHRCRVWAR